MKFDLTKVSLALLSAVFILGCQDLGTAVEPGGLGPAFAKVKNCDLPDPHPSCPDGGDGGGGGRRVVTVENVTVTDGMTTNPATPVQQMELVRKGDAVKLRGLVSELTGEPYFVLAIAMTETYNAGWENICETGHGDTAPALMDEVFSNLMKLETVRTVFVGITKSALDNGDHGIEVGGAGLVSVRPTKVEIIDGDINSDYFVARFSGGQVKLGGLTSLEPSPPNKYASELFCENLDEITFTVGQPPEL